MAKLKDRANHPPYGFQYTQSQTGWSATPGSFESVSIQLMQHRLGNKAVSRQYSLATDIESCRNDVDIFNAARCVSHGWISFVQEAPVQSFRAPTTFRSLVGNVVGKSKTVVAGVRAVALWLGDGLTPVPQALSEGRAKVCADRDGKPCPMNGAVNFSAEIMAQIREWISIKNDLALKTSYDEKLGSCTGCECDLKTKVHAPIKIAGKAMSAETLAKLDPQCWVTAELKQEQETKAA